MMGWAKQHGSLWRRRRRGTAILEFALAIPLLATVIVATFFFGWAMKSQQRVKIADRFSAWRAVDRGAPSDETLNVVFFEDRTSSVTQGWGAGPSETREDLAAETGAVSRDAGDLAQRLVIDRWPQGVSVRVAAEFVPAMDAWRQFTGPIRDRHTREGREWRRREASNLPELRDQFYSDMDERFENFPAPADRMADLFRQLYLSRW